MAQNETWLNHDLMSAVKVQYLDGNVFSQDNAGNLIGVILTKGGVDYSGGGSVSANVIRADGATVAVSGTLSSGKYAAVVLPQAAYAVPGVISIIIKLTVNSEVTTIAALVANVYLSSTDTAVDPGTIIPSITTLIEEIEAVRATIPEGYTVMWTSFAPAFSTGTTYNPGNLCTYDGGLYQFIRTHSGSWDSADVVSVNIGDKLFNIENALYQTEQNTKNLDIFSKLNFSLTPGKYVDSTNGAIYSSTQASATNPIDIQSYDFIRYKARISSFIGRQSGIAFYDRSMQYISGVNDLYIESSQPHYDSWLRVVAVPENAVFVRCSTYTDTETHGAFEIYGHNKTGEAITGNRNAVIDANSIVFKNITSSTSSELSWELGGFVIKNGTTNTDNSFVRSNAINVRAGSSIDVAEGYKFIAVMRVQGVGLTHELIYAKPDYVSGRFVVPQDCLLRIAIATNNNTVQTETGIESNFILNIFLMVADVPSLDDFNNAVRYAIDTSQFSWSFGGVADGEATNSDTRIRLLNANGSGGIAVSKGSVITANTGYKFNVFLYSEYISNSNFVLIGRRSIGTDPYIVPQDCFIRISVGTTNDDVLWSINNDGIKTFTEAGEAAKSGIVLNLIGGGVKEEIANVEAKIGSGSVWENPIMLDDSIPLNAVAYHALFNELVSSGKLTRELLGNVNNDESLPIYLYKLQNDMDYLDSSYARITWNGSNQLYNRPKIFLDSGLHGNERSTPFALFDFINKLCNDISYQKMRNAFDWSFIPLCNPWGFSHSAILISTGEVSKGSDYTTANMSLYNVIDNTESIHQGIRQTYTGKDINRDFGNFVTEEAQIVKDALDDLTADERKFIFAIDSHQAANGNYVNAIGAFVSMNYGAEESAKSLVWGKFMQAGAITEQVMAEYCDMPVVQSIFPWDGTNQATLRNYLATYSDFSMCFEGGQTCAYYSRSTTWSNPIARTLINTQYQGFLHLLTDHWM